MIEELKTRLGQIESRIQAITARQEQIPSELAEQSRRLGVAIVGQLASGSIHTVMDKLEREARELKAELEALAPIHQAAKQALDLAGAESAAERFAVLAAEYSGFGKPIFGQIDQLRRDLLRMRDMSIAMSDLSREAGRLSPVTCPEPPVFIPEGILGLVENVYQSLVLANGVESLKAHGFKFEEK